jgi:hypothetical protein
VNFTREPLIETIITPKEGFKLLVRNSKGGGQEEYQVESVEVVSFGHSFFFRSLEKPKSFLVPVSDYEIVEVKETRVVLKNASVERSIKIGGGREAPVRAPKEAVQEMAPAEEGAVEEETANQPRSDRRRDRRRHRRRRGDRPEGGERAEEQEQKQTTQPVLTEEGGGASDETQVSSSMFTSLFPPPPTLISETIGRYKEKDQSVSERDLFSKPVDDEKKVEEQDKKKDEDDDDDNTPSKDSEGSHLSRVAEASMSFIQETSTISFFSPFDRT